MISRTGIENRRSAVRLGIPGIERIRALTRLAPAEKEEQREAGCGAKNAAHRPPLSPGSSGNIQAMIIVASETSAPAQRAVDRASRLRASS